MEIKGDKITEKNKVKSEGQINKSEIIDTKQSFLLVTPPHQHLYRDNYKEKNKESINNNNNDSLAHKIHQIKLGFLSKCPLVLCRLFTSSHAPPTTSELSSSDESRRISIK